MKTLMWGGCVVLGLVLASCGGTDDARRVEQQTPPARPFDNLNPYGVWMDVPGRGEVWRPTVVYTWTPFTEGQWAWTDRGWMWMSDEPFGWVVYHYGSWDFLPGTGWVWFPGYDWSPARVSWFVSDEYVGWAPLPPQGVILPRPDETGMEWRWSFVPSDRFARERVGAYRTPEFPRVQGSVGSWGPDVRAVEARSGQSIPLWRIETERVRAGTRDLLRVRNRPDDLRSSSPPPPSPPPAPPPPMDLPRGQARGAQAQPPPPASPPAGQVKPPHTGPKRPSGNTRGQAPRGQTPRSLAPAAPDSTRHGR